MSIQCCRSYHGYPLQDYFQGLSLQLQKTTKLVFLFQGGVKYFVNQILLPEIKKISYEKNNNLFIRYNYLEKLLKSFIYDLAVDYYGYLTQQDYDFIFYDGWKIMISRFLTLINRNLPRGIRIEGYNIFPNS